MHPAESAAGPRDRVPRRAFEVCVALAALGPEPTVERFVGASFASLARALDGSSGHVAIASRSEPVEGDPLRGFRVDIFYGMGPGREHIVSVDEELRAETYLHDPTVQAIARDAGRHRVYHDPDPRTDPARTGTIDAKYWTLRDLSDRLKLVYALTADIELHFAVDRLAGSAPFDAEDVLTLEAIASGLAPWTARLALLHGYTHGRAPLSARERAVACALLGHEPTKLIASSLELSEARARELTRDVFKKLRVRSRLELVSAWLSPLRAPHPLSAEVTRSRRKRKRSSSAVS